MGIASVADVADRTLYPHTPVEDTSATSSAIGTRRNRAELVHRPKRPGGLAAKRPSACLTATTVRTTGRTADTPCKNFLYGFKAARRAARAADSARSPSLPLTLPLRRRRRRSAGAKSVRLGPPMTYESSNGSAAGVPAPAAELSGAGQNPSRPSVTAGQPHPSSCLVNVHAKTTLTEPARTRRWQLSEAGTRVARDVDA